MSDENALPILVDMQPPRVESDRLRGEPTYSVSTWDHEANNWQPRELNATKWQLRQWLRTLYAESWDDVSILIERNT